MPEKKQARTNQFRVLFSRYRDLKYLNCGEQSQNVHVPNNPSNQLSEESLKINHNRKPQKTPYKLAYILPLSSSCIVFWHVLKERSMQSLGVPSVISNAHVQEWQNLNTYKTYNRNLLSPIFVSYSDTCTSSLTGHEISTNKKFTGFS